MRVPQRPNRWRTALRRVGRAGFYLLAGVAIVVAVSWGLAVWQGATWQDSAARMRGVRARDPGAGEGTGWLTVDRSSKAGAVFFEAFALPGGGSVASRLPGAPPDSTPEEVVPKWVRSRVIPWTAGRWLPTHPSGHAYIDARGWPMLALWCDYELVRPAAGGVAMHARGGIELTGLKRVKGSSFGAVYPVALPLRPRWLGLLVNSLIYGAAVGVIPIGVSAIKHRLRRRAGLCERCGDDLRGLPDAKGRGVCPECGSISD